MTAPNEPPIQPQRVESWPLRYVLPATSALEVAPAMARAHVRDVLAQWRMSAMSSTAELVVSELVSNVVQAPGVGSRVFRLGLFSDRTALLVQVWDAVEGVPCKRPAGDTDENGRGLAIVEAASKEWGTYPHAGGKIVYALLENPL